MQPRTIIGSRNSVKSASQPGETKHGAEREGSSQPFCSEASIFLVITSSHIYISTTALLPMCALTIKHTVKEKKMSPLPLHAVTTANPPPPPKKKNCLLRYPQVVFVNHPHLHENSAVISPVHVR
ncbi:hypothetical protein, unlikely [Trypanosoma brucei gambiense DAL972]|uniref:Uncharacterized protein n=1 Tax=Trypanosoma brucei gambiense (strain MHOM/CI/86/DAL972) TaxID=679716 RepID=D0A486_TRYB9|nr:hypothetical protein, unlikely [Trypanosoma brucei gambiense DAL972]CBH16080.1 hypothetical protein, unlikely [Trypanosoma brucei gambiense DAL972]|eukprot:XP_011778344.1 hypothetical protein, unlikely [Trypanosoma brucei gambiense DAL972]